jgi:hypothetical protein
MTRGSPSRMPPLSSTASVARGFASPTHASHSSAAALGGCPLEADDIFIEIMVKGSSTCNVGVAKDLGSTRTNLIVERSFFVVPLSANGRQVRRPYRSAKIALDDIQVAVNASPEEGILFGQSVLKSDEVALVTSWLVANYSLASLQRTSVLIFQDLEASQTRDPRLAECLEQRALVVAEASGRRASQEAEADTTSTGGSLRRTTRGLSVTSRGVSNASASNIDMGSRQITLSLLQEKESIEDTLAQFNQKIALFAMDDPATAEMLLPAKIDLEGKLRHLRAQLASLGATETEHSGRPGGTVSDHLDDAEYDCDFPRGQDYVTDTHENYEMNDSSEDQIDLRMALPIEGSEYDVPFLRNTSGRDGYISSCDEDTMSSEVRLDHSGGTGPEFVIDLGVPKRKEEFSSLKVKIPVKFENDGADMPLHASAFDDETFNIPISPVMKSDFSPRCGFGSTADHCSDLESSTVTQYARNRGALKSWYKPDA